MKKNCSSDGSLEYRTIRRKLILRMKLVVILICIIGLTGSYASVYSQQTKLDLNVQHMTVKDVLKLIEDKSEFSFMYNASKVDIYREIDLNVEKSSIEDILKKVFAGEDVSYKIISRNIIISSNSNLNEFKFTEQQDNKPLSGRVTDSSGSPLPGVTVVVKGSTSGTITDANGNYSLPNVAADATISFSFIGLKTQEVTVAGKTSLNVKMQEENIAIDEVVAVGYGTQKRIEMTSSISSVKSEDFRKGSVTDAAQLIKGKVAGLTIVNADANPSGTSQILLRGVTTLLSGTQPLIVIDGVPGSLADVTSEDIESIDILKDGSAAAIYGTRATNGVILITTKKVKGETLATVEYSGYMTTQSISKRIEFMSADEYRELVAQAKPGARDYGATTDWQDEVYRTPVSQTHNVNMKGGNANTNYIMNVNYKGLEGLIQKSDNKVLNLRIEANHTMFDGKLKINGSIMGYDRKYAYIVNNSDATDYLGSSTAGNFNYVYRNALVYNPTDPVKDTDGNWTEHPDMNNYANPVSLLNETDASASESNIKPFGSISIFPVKGLTVKALASRNIYSRTSGYAESFDHIYSIKNSREGYATRGETKSVDNLLELTANYMKTLDKHSITLLGGYGYQDNVYESFGMANYNFSSDFYTYNNMGNGSALGSGNATMRSTKNSSKLKSYFARANYNYADKYMLMASIRYEGSTKFGEDHKWGAFPSVSAGWNIINESFMEGLKSTISTLKIRGGFGVTGTVPNDSYQSLDRLNFGDKIYDKASNTWVSVVYPSSNANPDLRWEKKEETNIGLDFGLLNNRISGSVDLYKRTSKDLLWTYSVPSPPYLYGNMFANAGSIENKGIEVVINATPVQTTNFKWNTTVTFSTNSNKMLSFSNTKFELKDGYTNEGSTDEPISTYTHRISEGGPVGNFYGYKSIDIDDNGYWIIEGADGKPKSIADAQPTDKKVIGNGLPKHYLNWNNTLIYKQFDLNITMRGAFAFQILNFSKMIYGQPVSLTRGNVMKGTYDKIYGKRPLADNQSLYYVSYFLEDGDYWKIDNVTLGYTLDFKKGPVKYLRLYASGSNLFTFTSYSGLDPELNSLGRSPGNDDLNRYPSTRSYTLGLSIKF